MTTTKGTVRAIIYHESNQSRIVPLLCYSQDDLSIRWLKCSWYQAVSSKYETFFQIHSIQYDPTNSGTQLTVCTSDVLLIAIRVITLHNCGSKCQSLIVHQCHGCMQPSRARPSLLLFGKQYGHSCLITVVLAIVCALYRLLSRDTLWPVGHLIEPKMPPSSSCLIAIHCLIWVMTPDLSNCSQLDSLTFSLICDHNVQNFEPCIPPSQLALSRCGYNHELSHRLFSLRTVSLRSVLINYWNGHSLAVVRSCANPKLNLATRCITAIVCAPLETCPTNGHYSCLFIWYDAIHWHCPATMLSVIDVASQAGVLCLLIVCSSPAIFSLSEQKL